jgi:hypothetical protein
MAAAQGYMAEARIVDCALACRKHPPMSFDQPYVVGRCDECRRTVGRCLCADVCSCVGRLQPVFTRLEAEGERKLETYLVVPGRRVFEGKIPVSEFVWRDGKPLGLVPYRLISEGASKWGRGPFYRFNGSRLMRGHEMRRFLLSAFLSEWICELRAGREGCADSSEGCADSSEGCAAE